ncbi:uncharacterized protein LOC134198507 [Corticium candelabrum]|uniref:uncharacterized protein LOC134198507 n=1 Tax=Corticium candelabrum TaxID=121492 RepID=UPI002E271221|nr:uncharacterized protein LOC134198507 [Corticium candelabrum]
MYVYAYRFRYAYGSCWKHDQYEEVAVGLSKKLHFNNSMNDNLIANGLIYEEDAIKIRKILSETQWQEWRTEWLLTDILPKTDNLGYLKFCCLLRTKFQLPEIANRLCKKCEEYFSGKCIVRSEKIKLFVGSSCLPLLETIMMQDLDKNMFLDTKFVHNINVVFTSSIVCIDNKIFVSMLLNIHEGYIDEELFQRKFAAGLGRHISETELTVYDVDGMRSTSMLIRLSSLSGLELWKVIDDEKLRDKFGVMIAEAMSSNLKRIVSIQVAISDMSSYLIEVIPTGTFSMKSDSNDGNLVAYETMLTVMKLIDDYTSIRRLWTGLISLIMFLLREIFILIALFMACIFLYLLWIQTKGIRIRFSRSPGYYQKGQVDIRSVSVLANKIFRRKDLKYDPKRCLVGRGGFADVYKAVLHGNMTVAFKKPNIGGSRFTDREMKDLKKESSILLAIPSHKHIVKIIGICIDSRHFGIILEYIHGGDLSRLLSSRTSDSYLDEWRNKLDMTCQIANGMKHLHGLHPPVIHRDLKPLNILVQKSSQYTCKISDFGLAKIQDTTTSTASNNSGSNTHAAGSLGYIAPERYGSLRLDMRALAKADIYSFGVILFQFRERIPPFGEENDADVIAVNVKNGLPFKVPIQHCPHGYDELTRNCCSMNRKHRPPFSEILSKLQKMLRRHLFALISSQDCP